MKRTIGKTFFILAVLLIVLFSAVFLSVGDLAECNKYDISVGKEISLLAVDGLAVNMPTIHAGTARFYTKAGGTVSAKAWSELNVLPTNAYIKASIVEADNKLTLNTTSSNKNSKNAYLDFHTQLIVPALTEYSVKYTITYTMKKVASNGTAGIYAKLYDYGSQEISSGVPLNAENLYSANGVDLPFNTANSKDKDTNEYWIENAIMSSTSYNKLFTKTFEFETVHRNESEEDKPFIHNYGYYCVVTSATGYASRMQISATVDAQITPKKLASQCPNKVSAVYTGLPMTLADVSEEQKAWYDPEIMDVDYSESADMINAGVSRVKAVIKPDMRNDETKFSGDIGADEDEWTRHFDFAITKKKIGVDVALNTDNIPVAKAKEGAIFGGDVGDRAPQFGFSYESIDGKGYSSDNYPTQTGEYRATVRLLNECNYELDGEDYYIDFEVSKRDVVKPDISGQSVIEYNGTNRTFKLSGLSDDVELTPSDGMIFSQGGLIAKKAGKYSVTVSLKDHGESTQWANSSGETHSYTLNVEITKAPLTLLTSCSAVDWTWRVGERPTVTIIGNSFAEDTTELYIYYMDSDSDQKHDYINGEDYKVVEGKKRIINMPADIRQGNYTMHIELYGDNKDNSNYKLTPISIPFSLIGNKIDFDAHDIQWRYNNIPVADLAQTLELTYDAINYKIDVDESNLRALGVKIDVSKGINGYEGDVTAKNVGNYSVKIYIVNYDNSFEDYSGVFTLSYKIIKAKYDISGLTWNYSNPLPYKTTAQSVILEGSLPVGLTVTYSGNNQIPTGKYKTTVTFNVSDTDNYYIPVRMDQNSYINGGEEFPFSIDWEICKATLNCNWRPGEEVGSGIYKLPILSVSAGMDLNEMVIYKYYDEDGKEVDPSEVDVNKENTYKAVAALKDSYAINYELANNVYTFTIGQNRYPVRLHIDLANRQLPYKGSPYEAKITIDESLGGVTLAGIEVLYFEEGASEGSSVPPSKVGKYRVQALLTFGFQENNYIDNNEFEFEIVKADFDVDGLTWKYTHTDKYGSQTVSTYDFGQEKWLNADGTEAREFVYDGNPRNIELLGRENIAGLQIGYILDEENVESLSVTNAGAYDIMLNFEFDEECYNAPEFESMITLVIEKAEIDTSAIVWGYSEGNEGDELPYTQALIYTRSKGLPLEYFVKLINLPDELKQAVTYSGEFSQSSAGRYTATYALNFSDPNYNPVVMPSGLQESFKWEIDKRILPKPVYNGTWNFYDGKEHSFADLFGIIEDGWENYISIQVKRNDILLDGFVCIDSGAYMVEFSLIDSGLNNSDLNWKERPAPVNLVEVSALQLNINDWTEAGMNSSAILDNEDYEWYLYYRYIDKDGNLVDAADLLPNVEYYKEVAVKEEYAGNVIISEGSKIKIAFSWSDGKTMTHRPTFEKTEITYDGLAHTIYDFGITGIESYIDIELSPSEMKIAGEYIVKFKFKYDGLYCWEDGSDGAYEVTLKINKMKLPPAWNTSGEKPYFQVPEGIANFIKIQYVYYDPQGQEVKEENLKRGVIYKIVATLGDEYAANFEFVDDSGEVLTEPAVSNEKIFTIPESGEELDSSILKELLAAVDKIPLWQVLAGTLSIIIIFICLVSGIKNAGKRKKIKKTISKKFKSECFAGLFLGMSVTGWTAVAATLIAVALLSIIFAIVERLMCNKAINDFDEAKDEYESRKDQAKIEETHRREEEMKMMILSMLGGKGGAQGTQDITYAQQAISTDEMRLILKEAVSAMLPGMPQYLPQQASENEQKLEKLIQSNEALMRTHELLLQKLSDQSNDKKLVAAADLNEELIKELQDTIKEIKSQPLDGETIVRVAAKTEETDSTIKQLLLNQEKLMEKILELSAEKKVETQVVEKIVEKPVEKIVEKEVRVEVPVEKIVEKVVEKAVPVAVAPKAKKEVAPRLTLDEAYEKLSKQQKKFFDGLREYAMKKEKCKEKRSTYNILLGQSTVNPLVKLTIKKDVTVALFKMEDEYLKDIRRNAGSDGTKVKVKETEVAIGDAQAYATAKEMIDLREDQIERYQDFLKEQRALRKS